MITQAAKDTILSALDMKLASIKRAMNTNRNPKFKPVYDSEEADVTAAKAYIQGLKITDK